jgi:hypothetical protein
VADVVSWLVIEKGWTVLDGDGEEIGTVAEVVGDTGRDIFSGLAVSTGLLSRPRFLPAERVTTIEEGVVHTDLPNGHGERLEPHEDQPSLEIRP